MNAPLPAQHLAPPRRYFWTAPEVATLTRLYPSAGPEACRAALPLRSLSAIYAKALDLGLHAPPNAGPGRRRWCWTEADLAELTRVYRAAPDRGAINALARRLDKPRAVVTAKAMNLGLIVPRFAPAPWTAAEEDLLRQYAHLCPRRIALRLRRAGHPARSETAVAVRRKALHLDSADPDHYTAGALAQLMGVDGKTVTRWIEREGLPATRRGTARVKSQGGDHWWISRRTLRTWIASHAQLVDLRKVERYWFIDLAFGGAA